MRSIVGDLLLRLAGEASAEPMNRRLYRGLREAILEGAIAADTRLPASRDLAAELGIARNTVVHAQPAAGRGLYAQPAGQRHLRQRLAAGLVPEQRTAPAWRPRRSRAGAPRARGHRRRRLGLALPMGRLHAGRARPDRIPAPQVRPHRQRVVAQSAARPAHLRPWRRAAGAARGAGAAPGADALDRLRSGTAHHHRGLAPGHRPGLAHPGRSGRGGLGRGPAIGARAPCCRPMACASAICRWTRKACRCRRKPAASRRASSSSRRRISTRWAGDVAGAPPPAAGGCAAPWQLDHRGRLRQRVPLRAAHRLAAGAGAGCARDLHGHLQQDAVPGAARGYLVLPRRWWRRSRRRTPSCTARATR